LPEGVSKFTGIVVLDHANTPKSLDSAN
jgi:hypothetical protein